MLLPPIILSDASLLFIIGAIILLITAELLSPYYGHTHLIINKKRLRNAALFLSVIFLIIMAIRIITLF